MKKYIRILTLAVLSIFYQVGHAEWQLVNENDPEDPFMIFAEFHNVNQLNDEKFQIQLKTSELPDSVVSSFPLKIYEPIGKFQFELDCKNSMITTNDMRLFGKMGKDSKLVDIMKSLGMPNEDKLSKKRSIVETDIVDMNLYNRLCKH